MIRRKRNIQFIMTEAFSLPLPVPTYASNDVAGAADGTWPTVSQQIKAVKDNAMFL